MPAEKIISRRRILPKEKKVEKQGEIVASPLAQNPRVDEVAELKETGSDTLVEQQTVTSIAEELTVTPVKMKKFSFSKHTIFYSIGFVLLVIALAAAGYFFMEYQKTQTLLKDPKNVGNKELSQTIEKVGKLIDLPVTEQPTVATVSDIKKLKGQAFFEKAQNGDKVLIYAVAKKAYLYRPVTNKLIDVAPVSFPSPQPTVAGASIAPIVSGTITPSPSGAASDEIKVALFNGSGVTGVTKTAEAKVTGGVENVKITAKENANTRDYQQTLVIDISGKKKGVADNIIAALGVGKVGTLPTGETKPTDADYLVILGTDFN